MFYENGLDIARYQNERAKAFEIALEQGNTDPCPRGCDAGKIIFSIAGSPFFGRSFCARCNGRGRVIRAKI